MAGKRDDYITWDEYFMGVAKLSALRSKDPNTQVGACIVNDENRIMTVGYNGLPRGCSDDDFPWEREGNPYDTKYAYVCHAELNAILSCGTADLRNNRVYVTLFPCNECAKAIIQAGIKRVVYYSNKYSSTNSVKASCLLFDKCGVKYEEYKQSGKAIVLEV